MKRILSVDYFENGTRKKRHSSNEAIRSTDVNTRNDDSDFENMLTDNNYVTPKSVVFVSSEESSSSSIISSNTISSDDSDDNVNQVSNLKDILINLKNIFPNIREQVLTNYIKKNKSNENCLENAINHFIDYAQNETGINHNVTQPSTSSAATASATNYNNEIIFIQNLFPNIPTDIAINVINQVNTTPNVNLNNQNVKESLLVDYIIDNKLNEIKPVVVNPTNTTQSDLDKVKSVIVDCDPDYLKDKLTQMESNPKRVEVLISELIENKTYPKLKDYLNRVKKEEELKNYLQVNLNLEEFLKIYPDPVSTFYASGKEMSESYKLHCKTELANKFELIAEESLNTVLQRHNYHLTPAYRQIENALQGRETELRQRIRNHLTIFLSRRNITIENATPDMIDSCPRIKFTKKYVSYKLQNRPRPNKPYPDNLDVHFFKELQFVKNENLIRQFIVDKERTRKERIEKGKVEKTLLECPCCCDDECLDEDMLSCPSGHKYCKNCVKRYAEISVGDCKYTFKCIDDKCNTEYGMNTLSQVLDPNMLGKVLLNHQNEEIKKAGLENLESCQYCTYAAIIDDPNDKVFRCLNPECLKETCRLCNEPNHLPLKCDEIEKSDEVKMRTWIENKVTEAMIRQCHKCARRFFKVEGCNMMHCVCGAQMCYLCRQPIKDYGHFKNDGCKQFTDVAEIHQQEMEKAYADAYEFYKKENPNSAQILLKYDPKKILDELNQERLKKQNKSALIPLILPPIPAPPQNLNNNHLAMIQNNIVNLQQNLDRLMNQ